MNQNSDLSPTCETVEDASIVPNVAQATDPLIDEAEKALRVFEGEPLTRAQAERLLSMWANNKELTDRERAAVLARFEPAADENHDDVVEAFRLGKRIAAGTTERAAAAAYVVGHDEALAALHAWTVQRDTDARRLVWTCMCGHRVEQPFGEEAPADLVTHPAGAQ